MQQWAQVLRAASAHRSYRWFYREAATGLEHRGVPDPRAEMPRSLVFCYQWINSALEGSAQSMDSAIRAMSRPRKPTGC